MLSSKAASSIPPSFCEGMRVGDGIAMEPDCEKAAPMLVRFLAFCLLGLIGEFLSLLEEITPREDLSSLNSCETTCGAYKQ